MLYTIGQKVVMSSVNAHSFRRALNGHTCTIVKVFPFDACGSFYRLEWKQRDNPGRECNLPMPHIMWDENDFFHLALPKAILVHSTNLPDV